MRVRLKGINKVRKRLADGTFKTYWYAWKGGPALSGEPGTPEFIASFHAAVEARRRTPDGELLAILNAYEDSPDFKDLAEKTRADYRKHLRAIEAKFGDFPLAALSDRRTRAEFIDWRDQIAKTSRRNADYRFAVLARVCSWAFKRGLTDANPCERPGRLYRSGRKDSVWSDDDESRFLEFAPPHLHLALKLALWTGQRQGDLLRLTWAAYDGDKIRLRQRKTGARVVIPVGAPLKAALEAAKAARIEANENTKVSVLISAAPILTTESGTAWTESGFRASWRKACVAAKVSGVTFHDLRGTAVTRLAIAGCSEAEIAALTGHALKDVGAILDAHYLKRDPSLAKSAITKLERRTKTPN
jgi:integrase